MTKLKLNTAAIDLSPAQAARLRAVLESSFPEHLINKQPASSRLRRLWARDDIMAAYELLNLADSIETANALDFKWTEKHLSKIVGKNINQQLGSSFEIIGAAMLKNSGLEVVPAKTNSAGFDLNILFEDGFRLYVSLKNHDVSDAESRFRAKCKKFRQQCLSYLKSISTDVLILVEAKRFPEDEDWIKMIEAIQAIPKVGHDLITVEICSGIALSFNRLRTPRRLSQKRFSDQVTVISQFYRTEQPNFVSKIESSFHNIRDQVGRKDNSANVVLMRLHATADIGYLTHHAQLFLDAAPDPGIDGIIFYQPAVIRTPDKIALSYYTQFVGSQRLSFNNRKLALKLPFATPLSKPSLLQLQGNKQALIDNLQTYIFQEGDYYYDIVLEEGSYSIGNPAPGIHEHLLMPNGEAFSAKIFAAEDELLLV